MRFLHFHKFEYIDLKSERSIYYTRKCKCGKHQLLAAGFMGDKKWHDIDTFDFKMSWEEKEFKGLLN